MEEHGGGKQFPVLCSAHLPAELVRIGEPAAQYRGDRFFAAWREGKIGDRRQSSNEIVTRRGLLFQSAILHAPDVAPNETTIESSRSPKCRAGAALDDMNALFRIGTRIADPEGVEITRTREWRLL